MIQQLEPIQNMKLALVFPGQGAQFVGMGKDVYTEYKCAKLVFDECEDALGDKLTKVMFDGPQSLLTSTVNAQPAILCHSIALLRILETEFGFNVSNATYALGFSI
jgi:[acyl-carrier-protein] S-malonyltransferase